MVTVKTLKGALTAIDKHKDFCFGGGEEPSYFIYEYYTKLYLFYEDYELKKKLTIIEARSIVKYKMLNDGYF